MTIRKFLLAFTTAIGLAVGSIAVLVVAANVFAPTPPTPHSPPVLESTTAPAPSSLSLVNYANYLRLTNGMTYDEVVTMLGPPHVEIGRQKFAGDTTTSYAWHPWPGTALLAMFTDGRLVQKMQFRLVTLDPLSGGHTLPTDPPPLQTAPPLDAARVCRALDALVINPTD
jgi:hypothetical protein